jgi:hypothetical protein
MFQASSTSTTAVPARVRLPRLAWLILVAAAVAAAIALTLALSSGGSGSGPAVAPAANSQHPLGVRYDGGPEEGTAGPWGHALVPNGGAYNYNGGHDEGNALR